MPDVLITENITGEPVERLKQSHSVSFQPELWKNPEALLAAVANVRGIIVRNQTKVNAALFAAAPKLEVVGGRVWGSTTSKSARPRRPASRSHSRRRKTRSRSPSGNRLDARIADRFLLPIGM